MGKKISRREEREALKMLKKLEKKNLRKPLQNKPLFSGAQPNRKCEYESIEQEKTERTIAVSEKLKVFRKQLPYLLQKFSEIEDPRNIYRIEHKLIVILLYGLISFLYQISSRREANVILTRPQFVENLKLYIPELETIPHQDTLNRLLTNININKIEDAHIGLIRNLIYDKKFNDFLIRNCYPIAIDGTQKFSRDWLWDSSCLRRTHNKGQENEKTTYYVYVLEANLVFSNGMSLPLLSEFLTYPDGDPSINKQDCETKAFKRIANRLKKVFPNLPVFLTLDGLYPNGPVLEICYKYNWDFMIVLQDGNLKSVWEEYEGLKKIETNNTHGQKWGNRQQKFTWINKIEYRYGSNNRKKVEINMVVCEETWEEKDRNGKITKKKSKHVWISNISFDERNVHQLCNLGGRYRWGIEAGILTEKHCGYSYEHSFSYNWQAMKGYHYLMRLAHLINIIAIFSEKVAKYVMKMGIKKFMEFVHSTMSGPWIDYVLAKNVLDRPLRLRWAST